MFKFIFKREKERYLKDRDEYVSMTPEEREFHRFDFYSSRLHYLEWSVRCIFFLDCSIFCTVLYLIFKFFS